VYVHTSGRNAVGDAWEEKDKEVKKKDKCIVVT
jgi:hypothetical protein